MFHPRDLTGCQSSALDSSSSSLTRLPAPRVYSAPPFIMAAIQIPLIWIAAAIVFILLTIYATVFVRPFPPTLRCLALQTPLTAPSIGQALPSSPRSRRLRHYRLYPLPHHPPRNTLPLSRRYRSGIIHHILGRLQKILGDSSRHRKYSPVAEDYLLHSLLSRCALLSRSHPLRLLLV